MLLTNRECQRADWKRHKEECASLALKKDSQWRDRVALSNPHTVATHLKQHVASITKDIELRDISVDDRRLGRCMVAKRDFNARDCVYSEDSYAYVPIHTPKYYACMKCLQLVPVPEFICPFCQISYCSPECMRADAGTHERFCHAFSTLERMLKVVSPIIPANATKSFVSLLTDESLWRLTLRILLRPEPSQSSALGFGDVANLCFTPLTNYCKEPWITSYLATVSEGISHLVSGTVSISADGVAALFSRLCHNVFSITSSRMLTNGYGVFPVCSFINHSCAANAIASFVGSRIRVYAICAHARRV